MQRQMSLKHHYLDDGIKDAFEMQIRGMTSILRAGINSIPAGHVVQALCVCVIWIPARVCPCMCRCVRAGII